MFDLGLLRKPTFTGGLIAAFGVSASIFSLLTYLVIYVQNVLGYSAVADRRAVPVPVRWRPSSPPHLAGRLTEHVPVEVADRAGLPGPRRRPAPAAAASRTTRRGPT